MDVIKILETLSNHGLVRLNKDRGNWYSVYCPFHSNGQERRPSCGVSTVMQIRNNITYPEGMWHCFTCQISYPMAIAVTRILKLHGIDQSGESWLVEHVDGYETVDEEFEYLIPASLFESVQNKYALEQIKKQVEPAYISESELASYRYVVPYMYERKLTDEIIEKYDVGYDANWIPPGRTKKTPCITFPVRDKDGHTLFICRRSIAGKLYNYPQGVTKPVYGIDMLSSDTKSVIICESIINALTAVSYGYEAVALLGTGDKYQIQQLRELGVNEFVICTDGDEAGRRASTKLKKALKDVALIWTINMPDGKDLNDCSKEEFDVLYSQRE